MTSTGLAARTPFAHTSVANVPGPQFPLYFYGAKASLWIGLGCLLDGMGLFHTVNSYNGYMFISYLSCREMMPDPDFYHQCMNRSLQEHMEAARAVSKPKPAPITRANARKKPKTSAKRAARPGK